MGVGPVNSELNQLLLEAVSLERRAGELKRRHERVIEAAAWFPNVVNRRQERELAAKRAAVQARTAELDEQLRRLRDEPISTGV